MNIKPKKAKLKIRHIVMPNLGFALTFCFSVAFYFVLNNFVHLNVSLVEILVRLISLSMKYGLFGPFTGRLCILCVTYEPYSMGHTPYGMIVMVIAQHRFNALQSADYRELKAILSQFNRKKVNKFY